MVESILRVASEILSADLPGNIGVVKVITSQLWYLNHIDFRDNANEESLTALIDNLNDSLLTVKEILTQAPAEAILQEVKKLEREFFKVFLYKLQLGDKADELIASANEFGINYLGLFEDAFLAFLGKQENFFTFDKVYERLSELLSFYGFEKTTYREYIILNSLNIKTTKELFINAITDTNTEDYFDRNLIENDEDDIVFQDMLMILFDTIYSRQLDVPPLPILKDVINTLNPEISNIKGIAYDIVNNLFLTINDFYKHLRINSTIKKFETDQNLEDSPLYQRKLGLQFLRSTALQPEPYYEKGQVLEIHPFGFKESSRFCFDRFVLLGKFTEDCTENDIFLDKQFDSHQLIILCSNEGYFLCDYSNQGIAGIKLSEKDNTELLEGSIFQLGSELVVEVFRILHEGNQITVALKVIRGHGLTGAFLYSTFTPQNMKIGMGREPGQCGFHVLEQPTNINGKLNYVISRHHCNLLVKDNKLFLQGIKGCDLFINLKTAQERNEKLPSKFYHLRKDEEMIMISKVIFKFTLR